MKRDLNIKKDKNILLLGPRQTGKSTLVKVLLSEKDIYINLLPNLEFIQYSKDAGRFHAEVLSHYKKHGKSLCVVDEIQKIPSLLNDVHDLIESTEMVFILTGSSARKLRHGGTNNLLAGRALKKSLFPFTYHEIGDAFVLEDALIYGTLPKIWNGDCLSHQEKKDFLSSYTQTYLREEIQQEGFVRNLGHFSRFLDVAAINDGQIVNYSTIARECGISAKTIQGYYEILEDTLIAYRIDGWHKSIRKQLTSHPKYYFFDCGVSNTLSHWVKETLNSVERGRKFEQFVILQMIALESYHSLDFQFYHWRDKNNHEVDLLVTQGEKICMAVEFKSSSTIHSTDTKGLKSFLDDNPNVPCYVVGIEGKSRELAKGIEYLNWREFLEKFLIKN